MNAKRTLKRTLCLLLSAMLCLTLMPTFMPADALAAAPNETPAAEDNAALIYADYGDGFELLTALYFEDSVTEKTVLVERPVTALRVVKGECYELNLDRLTLDGVCPAGFERKLSATDNDLIEVEGSMDFALSGCGELVVAARAPVELKGENYSFTFPTTNCGPIHAGSDFYSYTVGSNKGSFDDGDELTVPDEDFLFMSEMCYPDSGHPDAPMDIYVADDGETLYVFFEVFLDNTFDHGKDFAGVHVKCGDEVKTYKVHTTETNEFGRWWFDYTDSSDVCDWEHMCYIAEIPLEADDGELSLAFEYYGTAYVGEKLQRLCVGDKLFVDADHTQDLSNYDYVLPTAGNTFLEPGKTADTATWWITNNGSSAETEYTLFLNNANITSTHSGYPEEQNLYVYGNLTIEVLDGTVNTIGAAGSAGQNAAIHASGQELFLKGSGTLNLKSPGAAILLYGALTFKDGITVNAEKSGAGYDAYYSYNEENCITCESGKINVTDAELNVVATDDGDCLYGIYSGGHNPFTLKNATVTVSASGAKENHALRLRNSEYLVLDCDTRTLYEGSAAPGIKVDALMLTSASYEVTSKPYVRINARSVLLKRLKGASRQATAAVISKEAFDAADSVIVASGDSYADALAGVPLANAMKAPILLVCKSAGLDADTKAEIQRLKAKKVFILGGTGAVSDTIENSIKGLGCTTTRIKGSDRFATAVAIAEKLKELKGAPSNVFFVYSGNYPDALAVSAAAGAMGAPILYVSGDGLLNSGESFLKTNKSAIKKAYIIGGTGVVKTAADTNIGKYADVQRVYGSDRFATGAKINETFASELTGKAVCLATGMNFPDALAGGVLAAKTRSPMILVGDELQTYQAADITSRRPTVVYVFGGTGAVSDAIADAAVNAAKATDQ